MEAFTLQPGSHRQTIMPWLNALVASDALDAIALDRLRGRLHSFTDSLHPLEWLAALELPHAGSTQRILTEKLILQIISAYSGMPLGVINRLSLDAELSSNGIPINFARHHGLLLLHTDARKLLVACSDPFRYREWADELHSASGKAVTPVLASPGLIKRHRDDMHGLSQSLSQAKEQLAGAEYKQQFGFLEGAESEQHIANICNWILSSALEEGASDIHFEPRAASMLLRLRIDGRLQLLKRLPAEVAVGVINRLKIFAGMDIAQRRLPQDGRFHTTVGGNGLELRLSSMPTVNGEKLVVRVLNPGAVPRQLSTLGMTGETLQRCRQLLTRHSGLILITGPTGSGKSTTLYTLLQHFADGKHNICTVEDPVEMVYPDFNQTQVFPDLELDFAACIRALLRQDPDILMVGEIRDSETAAMAVQAALTGHRVFATLHTDDSSSAIIRLLDLSVPAYLLRAVLSGVIAQRLVGRLCPHCSEMVIPDPDLWQCLTEQQPPPTVKQAPGCQRCHHSGIMGRTAVYEILISNPELRQHISDSATLDELRQAARASGMLNLRENALALVCNGEIAITEALRHS